MYHKKQIETIRNIDTSVFSRICIEMLIIISALHFYLYD